MTKVCDFGGETWGLNPATTLVADRLLVKFAALKALTKHLAS